MKNKQLKENVRSKSVRKKKRKREKNLHYPLKIFYYLILEVSLFPIGVGNGYDEQQLRTLTGPSAVNRIMKLQNFEDLSTMVTLNSEFINKVCMGKSSIIVAS